MIYDVFISYRRNGGFETAKYLYDWLSGKGYTVTFDIDTLREGDFDKALLSRIEQCTDFILVVDRHCFDRTIDHSVKPEQDWLRNELAYALQLRKNIIPVLLAGAVFPDGLPKEIEDVKRKNGPQYSHEYFDSFCNKLKEMLHSMPRNNYGVAEKKQTSRHGAPNLKVKCNLDCVMYIDGEEYGTLSAGRLQKIPLAEGEYMLEFKGVENESDKIIVEKFEMPNKDKLYNVDLKAKKEERERQEIERKQIEEGVDKKRALKDRVEILIREESQPLMINLEKHFILGRKKTRGLKQKLFERLVQEQRKDNYSQSEYALHAEELLKVGSVKFKMLKVEGGTFTMGATREQGSDAFDDEKPAHEVTLSDYYIGETEVTQALWKAVMGYNPSEHQGDGNLPVEQVSWEDIVKKFIPALNTKTGRTFRLPTEAEWEYAARGGNRGKGYRYSGSNNIDEVAWFGENSEGKPHPVKEKDANELGLYDMSGNVLEWCQDWVGKYNSDTQTNPKGLDKKTSRVLRGGSWLNSERCCRVSHRNDGAPDICGSNIGFRLVMCQ